MYTVPETYKLPYKEMTIRGIVKNPGEFLSYFKIFIRSVQEMYVEVANSINGDKRALWEPKEATDNDATPDVTKTGFLVVDYSSNTTITNFDNGSSGQMLQILQSSGVGTVTIADNSNIATNTGANKNMAQGKVYTFRNYDGVWYEAE